MTTPFRVIPGSAQGQSITLNSRYKDLYAGRPTHARLSFGTASIRVTVGISKDTEPDEIRISSKAMEALHLPTWPQFELSVKRGRLTLGPLVGILAVSRGESLKPRRLQAYNIYVPEYSRLHGAVVAFALDGVDRAHKTVSGYCYDPQEDTWTKGVFPYPLAIYRRVGLESEWRDHFESAIGDRMFNSRFPDKWEACRWMASDYAARDMVPDTVLYKDRADLTSMLEKHGTVYVKPITGLQGRGVYRVNSGEPAVARYREAGVNYEESLATQKDLERFCATQLAPGRYIIQQQIDLVKYQDRLVDFRVIGQKDGSKNWQCYAIVGRVGPEGSIVSNLSSGGTAVPGGVLLTRDLGFSEKEAFVHLERIRMAVRKVGKALDRFMNAATMGLDLGLDTRGRLWILEINLRDPDHRAARGSGDPLAYYAVKSGILFYAKALAGFGPEESRYVL